jgi:hypothetical protein
MQPHTIRSLGIHGTFALFALGASHDRTKSGGSFIRQTTQWSQFGLVKKKIL